MKDMMKKVAKKEVKGHEAKMHGKKMAMGGRVMPDQSNKGGAMRGLDHAAAMSGREMPVTGRPMKKGGKVKKYAKGGGIEKKGKTRGKFC
jgi:hypothetical protein